jgi:hypothetical protein
VAGFTAVIDQAPFGVAKDARLLDARLAVRTAKTLGVKVVRNPAAAFFLVQQLGDRKNHVSSLPSAQVSYMSHGLFDG